MINFIILILTCLLFPAQPVFAKKTMDFTLHKLESGLPGPTLLIVSGIQGDEPGGFNAASLLTTHYTIKKGSVWVVPNLNFISIINCSRGVHGDLNRKFASIRDTDPEFNTIEKIKAIIFDAKVDVVLNHHDGSGFYRPVYIDKKHNPSRWGQSIIVDQESLEARRFGDLKGIAGKVAGNINSHLFSGKHAFHVKNTMTRNGNKEMAKTLTYYAINNSKPAFGVEVSKSFPTHKRAYYHLRAIEAFMDQMGIKYQRNFELSAEEVKKAITGNVKLAFYNNRIFLDVADARKRLRFIPFRKASEMSFTPSNPLITVVESGSSYKIFHGNRRVTRLYPQYFEYDFSIGAINMQIDGEKKRVDFGRIVEVRQSFRVAPKEGYRVNVIGFMKPGSDNESGIAIRRDDIKRNYSVDKSGKIYRVEVYRGSKFSGMVLVNFSGGGENLIASDPSVVPSRPGKAQKDLRYFPGRG